MTQPFADALTWMPRSRSMAATLSHAHDLARGRGAPAVTLEHLLLGLIDDSDASAVLTACRIDTARLAADVTSFLDRTPAGDHPIPTADPELLQILQYAVAAARQSRRGEVNGAIVLAAIVGEGNSNAAKLLTASGLTFQETVKALQQATAPRGQPPPTAGDAQHAPRGDVPHEGPRITDVRHDGARLEGARLEGAPADAMLSVHASVAAAAPAAMPDVAPESAHQPAPPQPPGEDPITTARRRIAELRGNGNVGASPLPSPAPASIQAPIQAPNRTPTAAPATPDVAPPPQPVAARPPPLPADAPVNDATDGDWMPPSAPLSSAPASRPMRMPPPVPPIPGPPPQSALRPSIPASLEQHSPAHRPDAPSPPWQDPGAQLQPATPFATDALAGTPDRAVAPPATPPLDVAALANRLPYRLRTGIEQIVEIRIQRSQALGILANTNPEADPAIRHRPGRDRAAGRSVTVRLRCPDRMLLVEALAPETVWLDRLHDTGDDEIIRWRWCLAPRRRGRSELHLAVAARSVGADGGLIEASLPEEAVEVIISRNFGRALRNIAGLIAVALAGAGLAIVSRGYLVVAIDAIGHLVPL